MASIHGTSAVEPLVRRELINFNPPEAEKLKDTLLQDIDIVARTFCESEITMRHAITTGKLRLGTISDYRGEFCIYLEYLGTQVIKPIYVCH